MPGKIDIIRSAVYRRPGVGRRELRELTGFDGRTITRGVEKLIRLGFITVRRDVLRSAPGRPGEQYFPVDSEDFRVAAVYVDVETIVSAVYDRNGKELFFAREKFSFLQATVGITARRIQQILDRLSGRSGGRISAIGLTLRDCRDSRFLGQLARMLEHEYGLPVYRGYPVDAFAHSFRALWPEPRRLLTVHFFREIELALLDGEDVLDKSREVASGLMHYQIDPEGPYCYCGSRGCMENYIHDYALREEFRFRKNLDSNELISLDTAVQSRDPVALEIINRAENCMIRALKLLIEEFHPDALVLLVLKNDYTLRLMPELLAGHWLPKGLPSGFLRVVDDHEDPGVRCLRATGDAARHFEEKLRTNRIQPGKGK